MRGFAPTFRGPGTSWRQAQPDPEGSLATRHRRFSRTATIFLCCQRKMVKETRPELQPLGQLLFVLTTDTRTPQGSIATGNTTHRQTARAACRKLKHDVVMYHIATLSSHFRLDRRQSRQHHEPGASAWPPLANIAYATIVSGLRPQAVLSNLYPKTSHLPFLTHISCLMTLFAAFSLAFRGDMR